MLSASLANVRTVLCLGAHPDDIEIGCGGTLLELIDRGQPIDVYWAVFGARGPRIDEAERSAERFLEGAANKWIVVKEFRDSFFPQYYEEIKETFAAMRGEVSPDLVFTHRRDDMHQDHRLMAELTWCTFRDHWILEYEIPKYEGDLGQPNLFVPLDEAVCQRKIDYLMEGFPTQRTKSWFTPDTYWAMLRLRGVECNSPGRFAEAFHCRKMTVSCGVRKECAEQTAQYAVTE
jgi:LmbE family N-acetylglucosaminyl deacetylase